MSIAEAPVRTLTIQQWYDLYHDHEGARCELVRGHAIMTPTERLANIDAAFRLGVLLSDHLGRDWRPLPNAAVVISDDPQPTTRIPDLVLVRADHLDSGWSLRPRDAELVVEVVSPSSVETDWVTKRAEYAEAGIPNYLIVDVRTPGEPRLWLFDQIMPGVSGGEPGAGPSTRPRFADPTGDSLTVTIRIPGADPVTIAATDLV